MGGGAREKRIGGKIPKIEEPMTGKKESLNVGGGGIVRRGPQSRNQKIPAW